MKIYIGNLDDKIQNSHLLEAFKDFGTVSSARVIRDHFSGKSKGFGFVEMPDDEEAVKTIRNVNGATWEGKVISVKKAFK